MFEHTFPVGRLVAGSLTLPQLSTMDDRVTPKIDPQTGQQAKSYGFGIAIPKQPGHTSWTQTDWGAKINATGVAGFPNGETQRADFSWKITDGDSAIPSKATMRNGAMVPGVAPSTKTGYPGHWVLWFSGQRQPQLFTLVEASGQALAKPRMVNEQEAAALMRKGYFFEVFGSVKDNKPSQSPGVYLNHAGVCLRAFGEVIASGPDVANATFGASALPAGASAVPSSAMATPPAVVAPVAQPPALPTAPGVAPNPAFLQVPVPPVAPAAPVVPVAPVRQMTALAAGATYESFVSQGWTDDLLRQHGYMA